MGVIKDVAKAIRSIGWTEPSPVQAAAIPVGMEGEDLLAQAQTGTGKTGTYGSIILSRVKGGYQEPGALVLVPTRELAWQVSDELEKLSRYSGHTCLAVYGGTNIEKEIKELKKGVDVLVATPGRLKDLLERSAVILSDVEIVVLDEADVMLDMGFAPTVNLILSKTPWKRQTMMFSATISADVRKFSSKNMINCREILISHDDQTVDSTEQYFIRATRESKRDELVRLIEDGFPKMIVFCRTKHKVDNLYRKLNRDGYSVGRIHGGLEQKKREKTLRAFTDGEIEVLIASDVASRGLDILGLDMVVNFDIPVDPDIYVHRIGRTGRAGAAGKAVTLVMKDDEDVLSKIEGRIGRPIIEVRPSSPLYTSEPVADPKKKAKMAKRNEAAKKVAADRAIKAMNAPDPEEVVRERADKRTKERSLSGKLDRRRNQNRRNPNKRKDSVKQLTREANKSPRNASERDNNNKPRTKRQGRDNGRPRYQGVPEHPRLQHDYVRIERAPAPKKDKSFDKLELSIGRGDGLDDKKLVDFVIKVSGVRKSDLGSTKIFDSKSRIQVVRFRSQEVVDEAFGQTYRGKRVMVYNLSDKV